jgi:hypothetical protein
VGVKEIKQVRTRVEEILKELPQARESDTLLYFEFHEKEIKNLIGGGNYYLLRHFLNSHGTAKYESISRSRRKIQEEGLYLPLNHDERKLEAERMREAVRNDEL